MNNKKIKQLLAVLIFGLIFGLTLNLLKGLISPHIRF